MRLAARSVLAAVAAGVIGLSMIMLSTGGSRGIAFAQPVPTPTLPELLPTSSPSPSPTPGGGDAGGNSSEEKDEKGSLDQVADGKPKLPLGARSDKRPRPKNIAGWYHPFGSYDTDAVIGIALQLRSLGWSEGRIERRVFPPFIVAGPAAWTDTWGAPRYGPAPDQIRRHRGQDVFCDRGASVLASESGTVEFDTQLLGGKVARLHRPDGSYFYYAHLAGWSRDLASGSKVAAGDVIGYCGNTGNAHATPPHVHFGFYGSDGRARNPLGVLAGWLRESEVRALRILARTLDRRTEHMWMLTAARRFGDAFAPDLTTVGRSSALLLDRYSSDPFVFEDISLWGSQPGLFLRVTTASQVSDLHAVVPAAESSTEEASRTMR